MSKITVCQAKDVPDNTYVRYLDNLGRLRKYIKGNGQIIVVQYDEKKGMHILQARLKPSTYVQQEEV